MNSKKLKSMVDYNECSSEKSLEKISSISILNDDCLSCIFVHLGIDDRIRIQRVCKRWQAVSTLPWTDMKKLVISEKENIFLNNIKIIKQVLKLCGFSLTVFHYTRIKYKLCTCYELLVILNKFCPNIRSLKTGDLNYTERSVTYLINHFTKLNEISLGWYHNRDMDSLLFQKFFSQSQNLQTVEINGPDENDSCIYGLNGEIIKSLALTNARIIANFESVIPKLSKLNTFIINDNYGLALGLNEKLGFFPNPSNLKKLSFHTKPSIIFSMPATNRTKLHNLQYFTGLCFLELCCSTIRLNDYLMAIIANNCKELTHVSFGLSNILTDLGIQRLAKLPKLEYLSLSFILRITDKAFGKMPELKTLKCYRCYGLSANGFRQVLKTSKKLENLTVTYCMNVDNEALIDIVKKSTMNRSEDSNVKLRLILNHTKYPTIH